MKNIIIKVIAITAIMSASASYAAEDMNNMNMMQDKFNANMQKTMDIAGKMETEKNPDKKKTYMHSHMDNMKQMMGMMHDMKNDGMNQQANMKNMPAGQGMQGQGMMNKGQNQTGMMPGGKAQMPADVMARTAMMENRMDMMQGMMEQMLKHMEVK